jgi:DNA-binding response OmpR family regulator
MPVEVVFVPSAWNATSHSPISQGRGTRGSRSHGQLKHESNRSDIAVIRVVIVDDEPPARDALRDALAHHDDVAIVAEHSTGLAADAIRAVNPDVVFVDIQLRSGDGFSLVRQLRERVDDPPLCVFVTGSTTEALHAFDVHAFDYVLKPLDANRVDATVGRVRSYLARRSSPRSMPRARESSGCVEIGDVHIDIERRIVKRDGEPIPLSKKAFDLLVALANADGRVLTRDQLLCGVWGYNPGVLTRTVDMHIAELRQRLERVPSQPSLIVTVRAVGYRMATDDDAPKATTPSSDSLSA